MNYPDIQKIMIIVLSIFEAYDNTKKIVNS